MDSEIERPLICALLNVDAIRKSETSAEKLGVDIVIQKPVDRRDLIKILQKS